MTDNDNTKAPTVMLRIREVMRRTGMKRSTIYDHLRRGEFVKPIRLGDKIICFPEHEIEAYLQAQIAKSREG